MKRLAVFCLAAATSFAADFLNGQGARAVIGQPSFTADTPGTTTGSNPQPTTSASLLGAASGVAYSNGILVIADDNRLGAQPENNRVLIYSNINQQVPGPTQIPDQTVSSRCPLCAATANVVLGQADFVSSKSDIIPPTQASLRQPTGVATDGTHLVVSDTNNNRILIWNTIPTANNAPADLVLGQPDFVSNTPNNGTGNANLTINKGLRGPEGVWIQGQRLLVADGLNNRVLIWNTFPTANFQAADVVVGQTSFNVNLEPDLIKQVPNTAANTMINPVAVSSDGTHLFVSDLGNNRVLIWDTLPTQSGASADVVVGQPDMTSAIANTASKVVSTNTTTGVTVRASVLCPSNGTDSNNNPTFPALCGATLSFPRFALSDGQRLFIADGGNDRVLVFNSIPAQNGATADVVLGQPDMVSVQSSDDATTPSPYLIRRSAADALRTPTSLAWDGQNLYVVEPYTRRVLVFTPGESTSLLPLRNAASLVIYSSTTVVVGGTIKEGDQATVKVNDTSYTYQVKKSDQLSDIAVGLANAINSSNSGAGDPNIIASAITVINQIQITARQAGFAGDNITIATSVSTNAQVTLSANPMKGGNEAARVAPGALFSVFATNLSDQTLAADYWQPLPTQLGGVQVFVDGIAVPLLYVSPTQINAQIPWVVSDGTSSSAYVRTVHSDGSITVTTAVGVPIVPANPGIFAGFGTPDPRPAMALHYTSYALGTINITASDTTKAGVSVTATINGRTYTYTTAANDTPNMIRDGLINTINAGSGDPQVIAMKLPQWTRVRLQAREPGAAGQGIPFSATASDTTIIGVATYNTQLCCASVANTVVDSSNPAVPGETIVVYATGLGTVHDDSGNAVTPTPGIPYAGDPFNIPDTFVSSQAPVGRAAQVIAARLLPGWIGIYEVQLELSPDLTTNPVTSLYIAQDIYISNLVTFPLVAPQ